MTAAVARRSSGPDPLKLVASMVCENGGRWGEQATPQQWADMRALLSMERPMYHMWLRPRGGSKTFDAGAATIAVMLTRFGQGDEIYAAANDGTQAGLLALKIASIVRNTPGLAGAVEVQKDRVIAPSTGAVLQVLSSDYEGTWGKTPGWMFLDEMCNWDNTPPKKAFATALLTSLPKRLCTCLIASTPSWTGHWSYERWQRYQRPAQTRNLWRPSHTPGPAPWQDRDELEEQAEDLGGTDGFEYRRLFLCEWASADDQVADEEALTACTRTAPSVLPPEPGAQYVIGWDIGWKKDHSAVVVAHLGERDGRKTVVVDRMRTWIPRKGQPVPLAEVFEWATQMSREYNGAAMRGDPTESEQRIQDLAAEGYDIRAADTGPGANSVRAKNLIRLLRDRAIEIPADDVLRKEILSLRLAESSVPGMVKLTSDGSAQGHFDRVMALTYAMGELMGRSGLSYRNFWVETRQCENCQHVYPARAAACARCQAPNPQPPSAEPPRLYTPAPGGWASALVPAGSRRCPEGHWYPETRGDTCPTCARGAGGGSSLPAAFARALTLTGRR